MYKSKKPQDIIATEMTKLAADKMAYAIYNAKQGKHAHTSSIEQGLARFGNYQKAMTEKLIADNYLKPNQALFERDGDWIVAEIKPEHQEYDLCMLEREQGISQ